MQVYINFLLFLIRHEYYLKNKSHGKFRFILEKVMESQENFLNFDCGNPVQLTRSGTGT